MSGRGLIVAGIVLTMTVWVASRDERKHWPDFSCHPYKNSPSQRRYTNYNGMGWDSCKESYDKYQGRCDRVCVLISRNVRTKKDGPYNLITDALVKLLIQELGINARNASAAEKTLMDTVRSNMDQCKKDNPEYATLTAINTPCEPWRNVTDCIDKATLCCPTCKTS